MYGSDTGRFHVGYNGYSNDHIPDSNTAAKDGHFIISHQTPELGSVGWRNMCLMNLIIQGVSINSSAVSD